MFFQKNIFEDLKLNKRFKVNKTTCYIIFNFFFSIFIFYFFIIIFIDHVHWRFVYYIITFIWTSYSIFSKSHTKTKINWRKKRSRRSKNQLIVTFFKFVIEHSICWLYHKITSINVINNENQNINENRNETNEMKINSTLCFSNLLLSYVDYIINLHR